MVHNIHGIKRSHCHVRSQQSASWEAGPRQNRSMLVPGVKLPGRQNCREINFLLFKPPSLPPTPSKQTNQWPECTVPEIKFETHFSGEKVLLKRPEWDAPEDALNTIPQ